MCRLLTLLLLGHQVISVVKASAYAETVTSQSVIPLGAPACSLCSRTLTVEVAPRPHTLSSARKLLTTCDAIEALTVKRLLCGHFFHRECLLCWVKDTNKEKCPTCHRSLYGGDEDGDVSPPSRAPRREPSPVVAAAAPSAPHLPAREQCLVGDMAIVTRGDDYLFVAIKLKPGTVPAQEREYRQASEDIYNSRSSSAFSSSSSSDPSQAPLRQQLSAEPQPRLNEELARQPSLSASPASAFTGANTTSGSRRMPSRKREREEG
jgi:hypothetical protein